jgi:2-polyprenyl-3-methyl-5-hydroxy-6-metoxy-1,4-benzoquinol methylase
MNLHDFRRRASELSGGTSSSTVKRLVMRCLECTEVGPSVIDFGSGRGELLTQLHESRRFETLAGIDLFDRPPDLPESIKWFQSDLNGSIDVGDQYDVVICSETIEHLENPRQTMRTIFSLLKERGTLVLTMPNQESIRSYAGLLVGGHFTNFLGSCYPAHITALLRLDLDRICLECGFTAPRFLYSDSGGIPKLPHVSWQSISFGLLRGRLFSDNIAMIARRP